MPQILVLGFSVDVGSHHLCGVVIENYTPNLDIHISKDFQGGQASAYCFVVRIVKVFLKVKGRDCPGALVNLDSCLMFGKVPKGAVSPETPVVSEVQFLRRGTFEIQ